jgi:hypothetical protein
MHLKLLQSNHTSNKNYINEDCFKKTCQCTWVKLEVIKVIKGNVWGKRKKYPLILGLFIRISFLFQGPS